MTDTPEVLPEQTPQRVRVGGMLPQEKPQEQMISSMRKEGGKYVTPGEEIVIERVTNQRAQLIEEGQQVNERLLSELRQTQPALVEAMNNRWNNLLRKGALGALADYALGEINLELAIRLGHTGFVSDHPLAGFAVSLVELAQEQAGDVEGVLRNPILGRAAKIALGGAVGEVSVDQIKQGAHVIATADLETPIKDALSPNTQLRVVDSNGKLQERDHSVLAGIRMGALEKVIGVDITEDMINNLPPEIQALLPKGTSFSVQKLIVLGLIAHLTDPEKRDGDVRKNVRTIPTLVYQQLIRESQTPPKQ